MKLAKHECKLEKAGKNSFNLNSLEWASLEEI